MKVLEDVRSTVCQPPECSKHDIKRLGKRKITYGEILVETQADKVLSFWFCERFRAFTEA